MFIHLSFIYNILALLSFFRYVCQLIGNILWTSLLTSGCFLMFLGYCICVFERYCFHHWDPYAVIFSLIRRLESLSPQLLCYNGQGYSFDSIICGGVQKGNWQYNPRLSRPPCCTTGRHGRARQKFLYWRHHNNSAFGSWYNPDHNFSSTGSTDDAGSAEPFVPPW